MTTATQTKTFLGVPVEGEIIMGNKREKQLPLERFSPLLAAVLDQPGILAVRWNQYTPYFNDGEPCEFNIYSIYFAFDSKETAQSVPTHDRELYSYGNVEIGDEYFPMFEGDGMVRFGEWKWSKGERTYTEFPEARANASDLQRVVHDFTQAIIGGEYLDVLLEAFGDHAEVTVLKDKILVESCDHD